jgi:hypothetical protein
MSGKTRTTFLSLAVIMVMVFSAISPKNAYADDDKPPAPTAADVTQEATNDGGTDTQPTDAATGEAPPTVEAASTEVPVDPAATAETPIAVDATPSAPVQDPPATEAAPVVEETPATDPALDPQSTEEAAPSPDASILSRVPENTEVAVLDANGESQPLATQAAADAIATSDPIWCPAAQAPTPGQNGCTQSFTSFDALLTFISGNTTYQGAGTIYVEQGAYQGSDPNNVIDFNNYNLSNIRDSDLTVQGGWNTTSNAVDSTTPSTFTGYSILIGSSGNPWGGSINIANITVSESPTNGIELYSNQNVNVDASRFERNRQTGAIIRAGENVNVRNSVFGNGDTFTFRVQMEGLDIESGQTTSLFSVVANDNYTFGTTIKAGDSVFIGGTTANNSTFSGNSDILGTDANPIFAGYGLQVTAVNDIALANVTASENYLWGAKLDTAGNISITDSVFNNNSTNQPIFIDDTGLFIMNGNEVALNNVTASGNRLYGAQINANGAVSITGSNFNDNRGQTTIGGVTTDYGHGLQVTTLSDISIGNTNANNNTLFGGQLKAGGQVIVSNSSFSNTSTDPATSTAILGKGLEITSTGNTSLANVVLDNNQTEGADIQAGGDVFLDSVTATNNGNNGVLVNGVCVHLNGGTYSGNGQYGLNLGTSALDLITAPVFSGNGAGDIFQSTPVSCAPVLVSQPPVVSEPPVVSGFPVLNTGTDLANNNTGSANLFSGSLASAGSGASSKNISLISFLTNSESTIVSFGTFIGVYTYVDTPDGLQIFALYPVTQQVAMTVP